MLYYDRVGFSEGIDVNKISVSKQCEINDVKNLSDIAIHCIISLITKNKALKLLPNVDLIKKSRAL